MNRLKNILTVFSASLFIVTIFSFRVDASAKHTSSPSILFKSWNSELGLSNDMVNDIEQDSDGFIWLATQNGLSRFDGLSFKTFNSSNSALESNVILSLLVDQNDGLWVGTNAGLYHKNSVSESFVKVYSAESGGGNYISSVFEDNSGKIWFSNLNTDIFLISDKTWTTQKYVSNKKFKVGDIQDCNSRNLYLATNQGLKAINKETGKEISITSIFSNLPQEIKQSAIIKTHCYHDDLIVLGHTFSYRLGLKSVYSIISSSELSSGSQFKDILLQDNIAWIATYYSGLVKIDLKENGFSVHKNSEKLKSSVASNYLSALFEDKEGNLWVGSHGGGVSLLSKYHRFMDTYLLNDDKQCIQGHALYSVYRDNEKVYLGAQGENPTLFNSKKKTCHSLSDDMPDGLFSVSSISRSENNFWLGTTSNGVFNYTPNNKKVVQLGKVKKGTSFPHNSIISILAHEDRVWLGTLYGLASVTDGKFKYYRYPSSTNGTLKNRIQRVELGLNNQLWIGSDSGLSKFDIGNGQYDLSFELGLKNPVYAIKQMKSGRVWFSEEGNGLQYFDINEPVIRQYELGKNVSVYFIESDSEDNLWVSSSNGLFRIDNMTGGVTHISNEFPIQGRDFSVNGYYSSELNTLDVVGSDGLTSIYLDRLKLSNRLYPLNITKLTVFNNQAQYVNDARYSLGKPIHLADHLVFNHDDEFLTIEFSAMEFVLSQTTKYRYHLKGFHSGWYELEPSVHQLNFSRLPPGDFSLLINSTEPNGQWSKQIREIKITVNPPLWLTWWAKTLYVLLVIVGGGLFYFFRTRNLRNQAEVLTSTVKLRTQELQQEKQQVENLLALKNYEFANVSHEFRTPLTLILGPVKKLLAKEPESEKKKTLTIVKRNGYRLLRMVDQLIYMERFRALKQAKRVDVDMQMLVKLLVEAFADLCEEKGIAITLKQNEELWVESAPDALERILLNLLSNAYKYTPKGGCIEVSSYQMDDEHSCFEITDSGIGIPKDKLESIFDRYERVLSEQSEAITGAGIGLSLVKELVSEHNGTISVESDLGVGTTFKVILPTIEEPRDKEASRAHLTSISTEFEGLREQSEEDQEQPIEASGANEVLEGQLLGSDSALTSDESKPLVLVIEDNRDMCDYIVSTLQSQYQTITAKNGAVGIELATDRLPDLIISDVMMPEKDGFEVCANLKQDVRTSHIPIILLTARGDRESRLTGWELNADEYLTKPFDEEELLIRVLNLLNIRSILRSRFAKAADAQQLAELRSSQGELNSVDIKFLNDLEMIVSTHYGDSNFNLKSLASELAIGERQLTRKMKAVINVAPAEYLRSYRLREAEQRLRAGETIKSVAFACGFSSVSYFTTCFKASFGVTPKQMQES